jgi:hypothetical protein
MAQQAIRVEKRVSDFLAHLEKPDLKQHKNSPQPLDTAAT